MNLCDLLLVADELNFPTEHVYTITVHPNPPKQGEVYIFSHLEIQLRKTVSMCWVRDFWLGALGVELLSVQPDRITGTLDGAVFSVWGFA